jgi:HK97 family phage portal protein
MSFFRSIIERREFSLQKWEAWLDGGTGSLSAAGVPVNSQTALTWAIVWGCVLVKSQDIAKVPLTLYRRIGINGVDGREEAFGDPVWSLLRVKPNPYMTPYVFRQTMQANKDTQGNAYAIIERDRGGAPVALWPRSPEDVRPMVKDGALIYEVSNKDGTKTPYLAQNIFHLKGLSKDGITGLSPIEYFREGIGLGLGYQGHASNTFRNQARPSLVASTPNINLSKEKANEIAAALRDQSSGVSNAGKVLVTWGGMELKPWGFSNKDADYINAARLSNEDACRVWRMPPYKVMDYTQSAYANMATASEEYVNDTLRPDQVNWEEEIAAKLISERDKLIQYAEHNNDSLLKGTPVERATVENMRLMNGTSTINEVRRSHNWKPVKGGDKNRTQMQMIPIDAPPQEKPKETPAPA